MGFLFWSRADGGTRQKSCVHAFVAIISFSIALCVLVLERSLGFTPVVRYGQSSFLAMSHVPLAVGYDPNTSHDICVARWFDLDMDDSLPS